MPGMLGPAVNLFALLYVSVILFFAFWPPELPVKAANMNYCILVTGAAVILSIGWYFVGGRRNYKGPVVDASSVD